MEELLRKFYKECCGAKPVGLSVTVMLSRLYEHFPVDCIDRDGKLDPDRVFDYLQRVEHHRLKRTGGTAATMGKRARGPLNAVLKVEVGKEEAKE